MLKIASRTFAAVGRVWAPRGATKPPPPVEPASETHYGFFLPRRPLAVKSTAATAARQPRRGARPKCTESRQPTAYSGPSADTLITTHVADWSLLRRRPDPGRLQYRAALPAGPAAARRDSRSCAPCAPWAGWPKYHLSLIDLQRVVAAMVAAADARLGPSRTSPSAAAAGSRTTSCRWCCPSAPAQDRAPPRTRGTCWPSCRPRRPT